VHFLLLIIKRIILESLWPMGNSNWTNIEHKSSRRFMDAEIRDSKSSGGFWHIGLF